jgi:cellulose synthase/poly-beta-1,6-N-acetylglucosamine synthase-like glycosyltransferase
VLTPIYGRHKFIPILIRQFQSQDYKGKMEIIILDDSPEPYDGAKEMCEKDPRIKYHHDIVKRLIPYKRNRLNELAKGDIIVCVDSDDVIMPTRVSHAVKKLLSAPKGTNLAGSTILYIYDTNTECMYQVGPYHARHGTAGTFAYKREYLKNHSFNENTDINYGEEKVFTNNFTEPMVQLNTWDTIVCINHGNNTFDKTRLLVNKAHANLRKLIKDTVVREFFLGGGITEALKPKCAMDDAVA